ncbi:hypothetical protein DVR12_14765 [Chitinophaga silvatica]|uniref:Uncharacterized protein n=1 Tax=Chitinophaga silvatica TaxID=2282649 RepID=A0A3E1Y980_9BACT|nr:class 1 isoprenoid biosynthesis enzyme [Chitinophaga silvatica]RFS21911.1 hypothetical protein DVR12_14765 [Chitinophaga silvatica]
MQLLKFGTSLVLRVCRILISRKKEKRWAETYLANLESEADANLPTDTAKKIVNAYSIYLPMVIDAFTQVDGRHTSLDEKKRILQYFVCSTTFDDFTDNNELTQEQLNEISFGYSAYQPQTVQERLFLYCHVKLKQFVKDQTGYSHATHALFQAQVDSGKQTDPTIPDDELFRITIEKGAYSVLLCSFYMEDGMLSDRWQECWFQLGAIIQLTNDLFDIWKDVRDGFQTLPVRTKDADQLYLTFTEMVDKLEGLIDNLPVPDSRKWKFRMNMMSICSFSDMAIQQLRAIQQEHGKMPELNTLPRKALIIDMEKIGNIWHCMRFTYQRCRK